MESLEFCQLYIILGERDNTLLVSSPFFSQGHCTDAKKLFAVTLILTYELHRAEDDRKSILSSLQTAFSSWLEFLLSTV